MTIPSAAAEPLVRLERGGASSESRGIRGGCCGRIRDREVVDRAAAAQEEAVTLAVWAAAVVKE